jgi:predicted RNase H-like nuclease
MPVNWTIVGVDCATQEERTGLARGTLDVHGKLTVERVTLGTAGESAAATISQWIHGKRHFILAMDAPLGWPSALSKALASHKAGAAIDVSSDVLFRRDTDRLVQRTLGKWPPPVGADRIARTSQAALSLLAQVREMADRDVPLAWKQGQDAGAIEVYPTASLSARGLAISGYKADTAQARKARAEILRRLGEEISITVTTDLMIEDADLLDALVCVLAGADFARGACVEPEDLRAAKKEGFIWFRGTGQRPLPY